MPNPMSAILPDPSGSRPRWCSTSLPEHPRAGGRMDASTPTTSALILCVSALRRHSSVPLLAMLACCSRGGVLVVFASSRSAPLGGEVYVTGFVRPEAKRCKEWHTHADGQVSSAREGRGKRCATRCRVALEQVRAMVCTSIYFGARLINHGCRHIASGTSGWGDT
jgi:hypothetical protein